MLRSCVRTLQVRHMSDMSDMSAAGIALPGGSRGGDSDRTDYFPSPQSCRFDRNAPMIPRNEAMPVSAKRIDRTSSHRSAAVGSSKAAVPTRMAESPAMRNSTADATKRTPRSRDSRSDQASQRRPYGTNPTARSCGVTPFIPETCPIHRRIGAADGFEDRAGARGSHSGSEGVGPGSTHPIPDGHRPVRTLPAGA
jgi:hypothetical protein